jgi:hypothetical protein
MKNLKEKPPKKTNFATDSPRIGKNSKTLQFSEKPPKTTTKYILKKPYQSKKKLKTFTYSF